MHAIAQCQSVMLPSRDNRSNNVTLSFPLCPADGVSLLKDTVQTLTLGSVDVVGVFYFGSAATLPLSTIYFFVGILIRSNSAEVNTSHTFLFGLFVKVAKRKQETKQNKKSANDGDD